MLQRASIFSPATRAITPSAEVFYPAFGGVSVVGSTVTSKSVAINPVGTIGALVEVTGDIALARSFAINPTILIGVAALVDTYVVSYKPNSISISYSL